ncbi:MAG: hypothetical protein IJ560_04555 [Alphaproteobacteria bacterium]|nr:hypothetical protein [Alphaproteobacteria bacterium]
MVTQKFHACLDRMALFTAALAVLLIFFFGDFLTIASANVVINGAIIGATLFGVGLCFVEMFHLVPEARWLCAYIHGSRDAALPPRLMRPAAMMLRMRPMRISANTLETIFDTIMNRFEDSRESVRYVANILIFMGLLGTFWGLIVTIGGFADIIGGLNFADESVLDTLGAGLARPLGGMTTAFTSSLLGLCGNLIVGFLGLQLQIAQNSLFHELEEYLAAHTHAVSPIENINEN